MSNLSLFNVTLIFLILLSPTLQQLTLDPEETDSEFNGLPIECPNIKGLGEPILIFHEYFKQTINVFNPKQEDTEVKLIYYRRERTSVIVHRFVFRLKNTYANRFEYVGLLSVIPKKEIESGRHRHFVIRYINTTDFDNVIAILGIYESDKEANIPCENMKQTWLSYILRNPYVVTKCEAIDRPDCVTSNDLTKLFSAAFELLEFVLASFGFDVSTSQLGYDPVILKAYLDAFSDFGFAVVNLCSHLYIYNNHQLNVISYLVYLKVNNY